MHLIFYYSTAINFSLITFSVTEHSLSVPERSMSVFGCYRPFMIFKDQKYLGTLGVHERLGTVIKPSETVKNGERSGTFDDLKRLYFSN